MACYRYSWSRPRLRGAWRALSTGATTPGWLDFVFGRRCGGAAGAAGAAGASDADPVAAGLGLVLHHNFITEQEEAALLAHADRLLLGTDYSQAHYDQVIERYREASVTTFDDPDAAAAVRRLRLTGWAATAGAPRRGKTMYPHVQLIDLPPEGRIHPHRDNMKLFGEFTAGLNLLSPAVMRFVPLKAPAAAGVGAGVIDVLLKPRTLYVMHGALRWQYTHEVLDAAGTAEALGKSTAAGPQPPGLERGRRVSVIARDTGAAGFFGGLW